MDWRWWLGTAFPIVFFFWWDHRWRNRYNELLGVAMDLVLKHGDGKTDHEVLDRAVEHYRNWKHEEPMTNARRERERKARENA